VKASVRPTEVCEVGDGADEAVGGQGDVHGEGEVQDHAAGDVEVGVDDGVEEAQEPTRRRPAGKPTAEELRAHRVSHLPFRDWCPECVAGRAKDWPHLQRGPEEPLEIPEVSMDYCFIREKAGEDYSVVLVGKDRETKLIMAHVVPCKGRRSTGWRNRCAGT
jgi:hypothetical protein